MQPSQLPFLTETLLFTVIVNSIIARFNPFNASCSKLLLFEGFSDIAYWSAPERPNVEN